MSEDALQISSPRSRPKVTLSHGMTCASRLSDPRQQPVFLPGISSFNPATNNNYTKFFVLLNSERCTIAPVPSFTTMMKHSSLFPQPHLLMVTENTDGSNSSTDPLMGISKSCLVSVALFIVVFACFSICLYYSISGDGMSMPLVHI